jgi:hypothetical protein
MRLRDEDTLDPQVEREIAAIDAALAGRAVDPDLADLADLAAALAEMRATPEAEFAAELDARAAAGFDGGASLPARLFERFRSGPRSRQLLPVAASALAAIVVATAVVSIDGGGGGEEPTTLLAPGGEGSSGAAAAEGAAPAPERRVEELRAKGTVPSAAAARGALLDRIQRPPIGPFASGERRRFVERSAQITLGTEPERVQDIAEDVLGVVARYEGIVLSSSVSQGGEGEAGAGFDLLIPSRSLDEALADLSTIAELRSREESTLDITAPTVTVQERLQDARAEVEGLLKQLADADTDEERAAVKAQLAFQRQRVAGLRATRNALERRANLARVSLAIVTGDDDVLGSGDDDQWTIGDAFDDAGRILGVAAGVTLIALAVLAPIALLFALALIGRRAWVRAGRERALEGRG